jgi:predicted Rossmann-fold nucleotide-binding protein
VVVGSNEYGKTLEHHLNVNWGVDPDVTFEDNPLLLGVDYGESYTKVRPAPSKMSSAIRKALNEVPAGIILDVPSAKELLPTKSRKNLTEEEKRGIESSKTQKEIKRIESLKLWKTALTRYNSRERKPEQIEQFPQRESNGVTRKALAVIGTGSSCDLSYAEAEYMALALVQKYCFHIGTPKGNPGTVLDAVLDHGSKPSDITLFQPGYREPAGFSDQPDENGHITHYAGDTKFEFRENLINSAPVVIALGGEKGTLAEAILALRQGKQLIVVKGYGAVGQFLQTSKKYKRLSNLHIVDSFVEAVAKADALFDMPEPSQSAA